MARAESRHVSIDLETIPPIANKDLIVKYTNAQQNEMLDAIQKLGQFWHIFLQHPMMLHKSISQKNLSRVPRPTFAIFFSKKLLPI